MYEFIEVDVATLSGAALDYAVAQALGHEDMEYVPTTNTVLLRNSRTVFCPRLDWSQASLLIHRFCPHLGPTANREEFICLIFRPGQDPSAGPASCVETMGKSYLEALCRCVVRYQLGTHNIELPKELFS